MKTISTYSQMTLQRFRPNLRRGWKRKLGCWLWVIVVAIVLALVGAARAERPRSARNDETRMANEEFVLPHSGFDIPAKRAGFGASDAVAVGIVMLVIVGLLVRLVRGAAAERRNEEAGMAKDEFVLPHSGFVIPAEPEPWLVRLRAFFGVRGVLITDAQALEMRAVCVPSHNMALVWLDAFLRRELRLRLFMTSLLEVQGICEAGGLAPMTTDRLKPGLQTQSSGPSTIHPQPSTTPEVQA
jgi:hypothetical protein